MNTKFQGLTSAQARSNLKKFGFNEIESEKSKNTLTLFFEVIKEPMILLLLISATIYFFLGDQKEGSLLLFFVLFIVGITIYQERKTEKSLEALKNLASPRALVMRDGKIIRIPGREVVENDLIILAEGDRIPADAIILEAINLQVDESLLTGESVAVNKLVQTENLPEIKPGGDNLPYVFSGTLVVKGHGLAQVIATGQLTQVGRIGKALASITPEKTLLQKEVGKMIRKVALISISLSLILIIYYGLTRGSWIQAILAGITMAMSLLPEEFPIILTIFLAVGAWRLSKNNVLTRRSAAIETLGSASVLCVDKTGTITENKMIIAQINSESGNYSGTDFANGQGHEILTYAIYACQPEPFDPMETAFLNLGRDVLPNFSQIYHNHKLVKEYPLEKTSLTVVHGWQSIKDNNYLIAAKGSPEAIMHLCKLAEDKKLAIHQEIKKMAQNGLRVLGVAKANSNQKTLPDNRQEINFEFLGLVGLSDPVRKEVTNAVELCYSAGVRTIMITGDYPETAINIAKTIGLKNFETVITGGELEEMSAAELAEKIKITNVFARVIPEQKLLIVNALKANGEIVAMTGDGVNDAPALKSAHIGIAMGARGTDVAREAASLILLDDNFVSIVGGIRLGRRIYNNLIKAMSYTLAVHIPIAGLSLIPVLLGWPLILLPAHIVFLELIIDPACTIVFEQEPADPDIMHQKPRSISEPIFSSKMLMISFFQGLSALILILVSYNYAQTSGLSPDQIRTMTFSTIIFSNLFLLAANLSWTKSIFKSIFKTNLAFKIIIFVALIFLAASIYMPFLNDIFKFEQISLTNLLVSFGLSFLSIAWFEIYKFQNRKHFQ